VPEFKSEPRIADGITLRDYAREVAKAELETFLAAVPAADRAKLAVKIEAGKPRDVILARAKETKVDLIVMGTLGRTGRARSLAGSVAESVVRMAPCPVLTVRAPD
jgi:universal stress protein A